MQRTRTTPECPGTPRYLQKIPAAPSKPLLLITYSRLMPSCYFGSSQLLVFSAGHSGAFGELYTSKRLYSCDSQLHNYRYFFCSFRPFLVIHTSRVVSSQCSVPFLIASAFKIKLACPSTLLPTQKPCFSSHF